MRDQHMCAKATSIIIPVHNQVALTRECVERIYACTSPDLFELIVVDNGSTDETPAYLASLSDVKAIHNERNEGVARAWNQGIRAATAPTLAIINNDILVTERWLDKLLDGLALDPEVGIVCPLFTSGKLPDDFAAKAAELDTIEPRLIYEKPPNAHHLLLGFCFLARRSVFDAVGLFDEQYEMCLFEDVDFQNRVLQGGMKIAYVPSVLIHHYESQTIFTVEGWDKHMWKNQERYLKKWPQARGRQP